MIRLLTIATVLTAAATMSAPALPAPLAAATSEDAASEPSLTDSVTAFEGYDFAQVVDRLETSVHPLQREMDASFGNFVDAVEQAGDLLQAGRKREAIERTAAAIDGVLTVRDRVLDPMWEGQQFLTGQIAEVRSRLARAVAAADADADAELDAADEAKLDELAARIADEVEPLRRKRLVAHYRTVRNLATIRRMADQLSPDQRKLWTSVLQVLEEASLAHQQVLMGSEVLFSQFEATAANLRDYLRLMDTVEGARDLLGIVRGADGDAAGMTAFAENMGRLQARLVSFNRSVEAALQSNLYELEAEIDALQPAAADAGESATGRGIASTELDDELLERMERVTGALR